MPKHHFIAFDIGPEKGNAVLGTLLNRKEIRLKEISNFPTGAVVLQKHYYWNVYRFYEEIIRALHICVHEEGVIPESVGITTWGVDFGLVGEDGALLRLPYTYRDPMTETSMPALLERTGREELYERTGIALHKFNTVYQLYAMVMANDVLLNITDKLLFLPDLLNFFLTGESRTEFTFATTSQMFNPHEMAWDREIIRKLGISPDLMQEIIMPGQVVGELNPNISRSIDVEGVKVISVASHDTASAIVSAPGRGDDWAYICSGTWSLLGVEQRDVIIDQRSMLFNFSNEGGTGGTFRFLKNIMGLWLLQECRRSWQKNQGVMEYPDIVLQAEQAMPFMALIDPDYAGFYNPLDMPAAIDTFCRQTGQHSPQGIGSIARTIMESLALKHRMVLEQLELITGKKYRIIHIVGGGSQNHLLCQFTANATGRTVISGPAESTATGNLLMQAVALGYLKDGDHARDLVNASFELGKYEPEQTAIWDDAYENFCRIAKQN